MASRSILASQLLRSAIRPTRIAARQFVVQAHAARQHRHAPLFLPQTLRRGSRPYSQPAGSKIWSFEEVQKLSEDPDSQAVIVDTREPAELKATGRIPGAVNIPITSFPDSFHITEEDFEDRFGYTRPGKDAEVVFYCKAGVRSRAAAGLAQDAGWTKVGEYPGSWVDWAGKGGKSEPWS